MSDGPGDYAGFVTRAIAFAIDVALIDLAAAFVAIVAGLGMSALDLPDVVVTITIAIGTLAYLAWSQRPSQAHHHPGRLRHRPRGVKSQPAKGGQFSTGADTRDARSGRRLGVPSLHRRGRSAARTEWRLITATHNLTKLPGGRSAMNQAAERSHLRRDQPARRRSR